MSLAVQVLVTGLAAGAVYGLVGIGHTVIYRLTGIVYLAFGDLIGLGVFATLLVADGTGPVTEETAAAPRFLLALAVGAALTAAVSAAGYVAVVQPFLSRGSTIGWVAGTLALAVALRSAIEAVFPRPGYVFPDPIPFHRLGHDGFVTLAGAEVRVRVVFVGLLAVGLAVAATVALTRTRFGAGLRAIASDEEGAYLVGVPVERYRALAFALAGGLAALVAVAAAPSAPVDPATGALLGLKGLAAAVLARFGGFRAVFAAGLAIGAAESALSSETAADLNIDSGLREVLPLAVALLVLLFRPPRQAVPEVE